MSEISLHVLANTSRATAYNDRHKANIQERNALNPGGATGIVYQTTSLGRDGYLTFRVPKLLAAKNDAIDAWHNLSVRTVQTAVDDIAPDEASGEWIYSCKGHAAHYGKGQLTNIAEADNWVEAWVRGVMLDDALDGWAADPKKCPWVNTSDQYIYGGPNYIVRHGYSPAVKSEQVLADMLKYADYVHGIFPGLDGPDELGCYAYWQPRLTGKTVDWIIEPWDYEPGDIQIRLDWREYCNYVYYLWKDSVGTTQAGYVMDDTSRAIYTPDHYEQKKLDLTGGQGYLTAANAQAIAQTYLNKYKVPRAIGTIRLPLGMIKRAGRGKQWSGLIRAGDVLKIPSLATYEFDENNPVDNITGFLAYQTTVNIDDGIININVGEDVDEIEHLINQLIVRTAAA